jgi:hypothetical protein
MPASQEGIDVPSAPALDFGVYSNRLKSYGISLKNGDSVMVTRVRVKEKLIEFQLGGGGYGTFGGDTGSVSAPTASKTQREKDLEKAVKNETDAARKKRLQRELDDLRKDREREDARNKSVAEAASEAKKDRIATARLHAGSRFNIRYQNGVPPGLEAAGIMRALAEHVELCSRPTSARSGRTARSRAKRSDGRSRRRHPQGHDDGGSGAGATGSGHHEPHRRIDPRRERDLHARRTGHHRGVRRRRPHEVLDRLEVADDRRGAPSRHRPMGSAEPLSRMRQRHDADPAGRRADRVVLPLRDARPVPLFRG